MSRDASIEIDWAGDRRNFRLGIGELLSLEDKRDAGCAELLNRITAGRWRLGDVQETVRLGLMGGGVDGKVARRLVDEHVVPGALAEAALLANAILSAALLGDVRDPVGKSHAATEAPEATASPPPPIMETAQS